MARKRMQHRLVVLGGACALFLLGAAHGQAVPVVNPSFEQGKDTPSGWTLSAGDGAWIQDAAKGDRAIAVTGNGDKGLSNYWRSETLPFEPFTVYRLRFQARRIEGNGGCPTSGPAFCNRDLHGLASEWTPYTSFFITPNNVGPGTAWLRFGQWEVDGTVAYDGVELCPAQPVYRTANGISLGEGESIDGAEYRFTAPLGGSSFNHARPLARLTCSYNAPRLVFGADSELIYRHEIAAFAQTAAQVEVNVGYHARGVLHVELSVDRAKWTEIGSLDAVSTKSFQVPAVLLPATELSVRLRTSAPHPASLQVHGYTYRATLDATPGDLRGATRFVAVTQSHPLLNVFLEGFGDGVPGGDNVLTAQVQNAAERSLAATASVTLTGVSGKTARAEAPLECAPGTQAVRLPYTMPGTGAFDMTIALDGEARYRAETSFEVPGLYACSYGETLPASTDTVGLWWASAGWKVSRARPLPGTTGKAIRIQAAKNEVEAAQLVLRPGADLPNFIATSQDLTGPGGAVIPAANVEVLRVGYVPVTRATDATGVAAPWPDPLPPFQGPINLEAKQNQPLWIRVKAPRDVPAGRYRGAIRLTADGYEAEAPVEVEVFDFVLPDRMSCTTAFGFSGAVAFRYHQVTEPEQKRAVYDQYLAALSAHHISPYNPAELDPLPYTWPEIEPGEEHDAAALEALKPTFDWAAWDAAMTRAIDHHHFNSFRLGIPGMGGGTFHARYEPKLLGFGEDTPEYQAAFTHFCQAMQEHLREKGWLDEAFVYWFDEPSPKDYEFVNNGFRKLKEAAPEIARMLTEQVEPELVGGPNIWCPLTPSFDLEVAQARRPEGERFWWYVCTGPKAPYVTLFIDHPATEMRVWLWQTWKRRISGLLIWQTNYWTSSAAYPDPEHPQNPYTDPMGWRSGYSTPAGVKAPWGNGDGRFLYPPEAAADGRPAAPVLDAPVDSIRFEMLRDGIEDYEYLALLDRLLKERGAQLSDEERQRYEALLEVPDAITADLTHFTTDPAPIEARREALARAIERLRVSG